MEDGVVAKSQSLFILNNYWGFIVLITLLSAAGLLATDIFLPAMPLMTKALNTSMSSIQSLISLYLLSLACGQIIYGYLSDSYGRKTVLLTGLFIFTLSSFILGYAHSNIHLLQFYRFMQGFGAAAGLVIGRAIVGDLYAGLDAAKVFATFYPIITIFPALIPILGGYITTKLGWQYTFVFTAYIGVILIVLVFTLLPETNKMRHNSRTIEPILQQYVSVLSSREFWSFTIVVCCAYGAYFAYIACAPFLFSQMGYNPQQIGYFFIPISVSYFIFNIVCRKLIYKIALNKLIAVGIVIFFVGAILFLSQAILGLVQYPWQIYLSVSILAMGNGFLLPLGASGVVNSFTELKGVASGLMGAFQLAAAALGSYLASKTNVTVLSTALLLSFIATFMVITMYLIKDNRCYDAQ